VQATGPAATLVACGAAIVLLGLAAVAVTTLGFSSTFLIAAGVAMVSAVATSALQRPGLPNTLPEVGAPQTRPAG